MNRKITVLVIDDSALMRRELKRIIGSDPALRVIGTARDGMEGLEQAKLLEPDVVTIDLNLPVMDGLACLQHIMIETPRPCVVISAHTGRDSVETFEALELGAVDFVEKPSGEISRDIAGRADAIIDRIKKAARANIAAVTRLPVIPEVVRKDKSVTQPARIPGGVVVIGVSTGGPRTVMEILPLLPDDLGVPVIVIQHMPEKFVPGFAARLDSHCRLGVRVVQGAEPLQVNTVHVAPGGLNLFVAGEADKPFLGLAKPSPHDIFVPSVNVTMNSAVDVFGNRVVGVILTGMGNDGADAMERLFHLGGATIAESKESAVIFGMPKEVIDRGAARVVAPSKHIAQKIVNAVKRIHHA